MNSTCILPGGCTQSQSHPYYRPRVPFYFSDKPNLIDGFHDYHLSLAAPIVAYWAVSLFFHLLDVSGWKWLEKYRIHESAEVQKRNLVTRAQVVWAVLVQQVVQTALGFVALTEESHLNLAHHDAWVEEITAWLEPVGRAIVGGSGNVVVARVVCQEVAWYVYWWGIPAAQVVLGMFILDTWQYFLHRLMHVNKFMYKHFHSWHHRLNVPYAFGALYNHPIEGLLLDTAGALFAQLVTGMSTRQAAFFFVFSTFKTVDDHCGYNLPFDPLQLLTSNNADYHDIHHQVVGIKSNFAQPFFVHWDAILGTRMTRQDLELRRLKLKLGIKNE